MKPSFSTVYLAAFVCGIFALSVACLWYVTGAHTFMWDEAVYLSKARSWISGTPADTFAMYRPVGMAWAGWIMLHVSDSEKIVRLFGVVSSALSLALMFLLFRSMSNIWFAAVIVLFTATSPLFLREGPQFLNDIPAAGLLCGVLWAIWKYYKTGGKSQIIYLAAPSAALAFYLRYGAALPISIIGVSTLALFRKFLYKGKQNAFSLSHTVSIFFILILPHALYALYKTGSIFGVLTASGDAAGRAYLGEGLKEYFNMLLGGIGGPLVDYCAIVGACATVSFLFFRAQNDYYRGLAWLGSIGILNFFLVGLLVHAEPRYVFFPLVLLSGVGVMSIYFFIIHFQMSYLLISFLGVLFGLSVFFGNQNIRNAKAAVRELESNEFRNTYADAYRAIGRDAKFFSACTVWTQEYFPQASWYSGCRVSRVPENKDAFMKASDADPSMTYYSVVFERESKLQIRPSIANEYGVSLVPLFVAAELPATRGFGAVFVYRLARPQ